MIVQLFSKAWNTWTTATRPAISPTISRAGPQMSEVFDDIIDRETDAARIAAVVASDFRFSYFGTAAFAVRRAIERRAS
jgi:hypothetical protein